MSLELGRRSFLEVAGIAATWSGEHVQGATKAWSTASGYIIGQVTDTTGESLQGVSITVESKSTSDSFSRSVTTDSSGNYRVEVTGGKTYVVTAEEPGYSTYEQEKSVASGETVGIDIVLEYLGQGGVAGVVTDEYGNDFADASVAVVEDASGETVATGTTNVDGEYGVLEVTAQKSYHVEAEFDGGTGASTSFTVESGIVSEADVVITGASQAPTARFSYSPSDPVAGDPVDFDGSASSDPDESIASYEWDFDDDGEFEATGATVSHAFDAGGDYPVTLLAVDGDGVGDMTTKTVSVSASNDGPTASFSYSPSDPGVGESVTFDGTESGDPDGSIVSYEWDFDGDGRTDATGATVNHSFGSAGNRSVTLRVTDDDGATDSTTRTVSVSDANAGPTASFSVSADGDYAPPYETSRQIHLDASESGDPDGSVVAYEWDLDDDGEFERSGREIDHTYSTPGEKEITLRVEDDAGATSETSETISVAFEGHSEKLDLASNVDSASVLSTVSENLGSDVNDEALATSSLDALNAAGANGDIPPEAGEEAVYRLQQAEFASQRLFELTDVGTSGPGDTLQFSRRLGSYVVELATEYLTEALLIGETIFENLPDWARIDEDLVSGLIDDGLSRLLETTISDSEARDEIRTRCKEKTDGLLADLEEGTISTAEELSDAISTVADELLDFVGKVVQATFETGAMDAVVATSPLDTFNDVTEGRVTIWNSLVDAHEAFRPENLPSSGEWQGSHDAVSRVVTNGVDEYQRNMENMADWLDIIRNHVLDIGILENLIEAWDAFEDVVDGEGSIWDAAFDAVKTLVNVVQAVLSIVKAKAGLFVAAGSTSATAEMMVWGSNRSQMIVESVIAGEDRLRPTVVHVPSPDPAVEWIQEFEGAVDRNT